MQVNNVDLKQTRQSAAHRLPMKANLPQTSRRCSSAGRKTKLYERIREARAGRPLYVLHDGPPYANGRIHLGTAFNKILKDFIVKSKTMAGFDAPYVPGWDCHGLPIEIKVDSELGAKKAQMSAAEIRARVPQVRARSTSTCSARTSSAWACSGRWDDPYLTMSARVPGRHRAARSSISWTAATSTRASSRCTGASSDRTALAEAEVEYENHTSPSIWVRFALTSDPAKIDPALAGRKVYGLIWTTTPWTIPANMAIAFHPKFEYAAVEVGGRGLHRRRGPARRPRREKCGWKA